jgi:hypothetical protein
MRGDVLLAVSVRSLWEQMNVYQKFKIDVSEHQTAIKCGSGFRNKWDSNEEGARTLSLSSRANGNLMMCRLYNGIKKVLQSLV